MRVLKRRELPSIQKLRLVGPETNEIVTAEDAFRQADEKELDVVCVSDKSDLMVVRIEDYKKLEYERKKSRKAQKSNTRNSTLKEVQFKMQIADHDLEIKVNRVRAFLERGDKVKASVRLRGRERAHPHLARQLINKVAEMAGAKLQAGGPSHVAILEINDKAKN
ncbi:MAG: translation initiation factor IF-3 [Oligoflexus sp.]